MDKDVDEKFRVKMVRDRNLDVISILLSYYST